MNLYYDFFILVSTNQKLSKLNIFSCFLRFYWRNRTVFTQIICEYFNRFNIVFHISHINRYLWPTKTPKIRRNIEIWFTFDFHKPKNLNRNINPWNREKKFISNNKHQVFSVHSFESVIFYVEKTDCTSVFLRFFRWRTLYFFTKNAENIGEKCLILFMRGLLQVWVRVVV